MATFLGNNSATTFKVGANDVGKIYLGNDLVFGAGGPPVFNAEAVKFNKSAYLSKISLSDADSTTTTLSAWFYKSETSDYMDFVSIGANSAVLFYIRSTPTVSVTLINNSGGLIVDSLWSTVSLNTWHHLLFSRNLNSGKLFLDGEPIGLDFTGSNELDPISISGLSLNIGKSVEYGDLANSEMAEVYMSSDYLDLNILSNREKFIKNNKPVYLGDTGQLPTGNPAQIYMSGDASIWNNGTNKGSMGALTMNSSTVTTSTNLPVEL